MENKCTVCGGTGWSGDLSLISIASLEFCSVCHGSGRTIPSVIDYNDLIPPTNPDYPWQPKSWPLLCYYCAQPIVIGIPEAGYRQRTLFMQGMWSHEGEERNYITCVKNLIRPDIDLPRCHICGTQTSFHGSICSAVGIPICRATPMSTKEEELIQRFGWHSKQEQEKKQQTNALETVGALAVAAGLIGLLKLVTLVTNGKKTP